MGRLDTIDKHPWRTAQLLILFFPCTELLRGVVLSQHVSTANPDKFEQHPE